MMDVLLRKIKHFSLHDGPGIRTVLVFDGCNLNCTWCYEKYYERHLNNTTLLPNLQEQKGISMNPFEYKTPVQTAIAVNQPYDVSVVLHECVKDRNYYGNDGGVTFSGGEPTMQFDALLYMAKMLKSLKINTCLLTNAVLPPKKLLTLTDFFDTYMISFKHFDSAEHKKYTGEPNDFVYENIKLLDKLRKNIIVQCPIYPGINDTIEHFDALSNLKKTYKSISLIEILPYEDLINSSFGTFQASYPLTNE